MLKIAGAVCLLTGGILGGNYLCFRMYERERQLKMLRQIFVLLKGEIEFARLSLPEAFLDISGKVTTPFSTWLEKISHELNAYKGNDFFSVFSEETKLLRGQSQMTAQDLEKLIRTGRYLGFLDRQVQLHTLESYLYELDRDIQVLEEALPSKKKIYQSLGIAGSLLVWVILV